MATEVKARTRIITSRFTLSADAMEALLQRLDQAQADGWQISQVVGPNKNDLVWFVLTLTR